MKEENISAVTRMRSIIDGIGTAQTTWGIVLAGAMLIAFIFCVLTFTKKINNATREQVRRFEREGKYLPSTYIELNNSMEYLRYLIFSYKWQYRIIRQYNHLFRGHEGKRLQRLLEPSERYRLSVFTSFSELNTALSVMHDKIAALRKERRELYDKYGQVVWAVTNSTYNHVYAIEHLQNLCAMMRQKNVILVGSAGNGKTSLLCRMAEVAVCNKIPCMLVNSRDIKEDCTEYIIKKLPLLPKLRNVTWIYLKLISLLLFLQRKYFYIFIDAINENDRDVFTSSISTLLEEFSKYGRIRILLTCRREYFDLRYKTLFSACKEEPYILNLQEAEYDERATIKLIKAYMQHFNISGPFSLETQEKLKKSLFLTRIFFEVNSNRDECMLEFRNAEIYKLYFERIASENKGVDLYNVINNIAQYMFSEFKFDRIPMDELHLSYDELDSLKNLLDNNLIISRSVHSGTGITEREEEYVYFVFDELRDFCLARYLLTLDESTQSKEYEVFFSNATRLFEQRLSPVEGIIKYAYHYFRMTSRVDLCERILKEFGESDVQHILDWENRHIHRQRFFNNFGLSLFFSEGNNLASFEIDYMLHCIEKDPSHFWDILWFLLGNEYSGFEPNVHLAVDILSRLENNEIPEKIFEFFFADKAERIFSYPKGTRRVDNLQEWLKAIEKNCGTLSDDLKVIVVILAAHDPTEFALMEYHYLVMDEEVFKHIQESGICMPIRNMVKDFKEWMLPKSTDQNTFFDLIGILMSEGYCE